MNGYLIFDTGIQEKYLDDIINTVTYKDKSRIRDAWINNNHVKALAKHLNIINKIKYLYDKEPLPFQTVNFKVGTSQNIHSDTIHFNSYPKQNMCAVWVALEDITEDNGPLFYYPGSQQEPEFTYEDFNLQSLGSDGKQHYQQYEIKLQEYIDSKGYQRHQALMKKGQAIIWAANLLHGGEKVKDISSTRHSQVTHYFFESEYYYTPLMCHKDKIAYRNPTWIK